MDNKWKDIRDGFLSEKNKGQKTVCRVLPRTVFQKEPRKEHTYLHMHVSSADKISGGTHKNWPQRPLPGGRGEGETVFTMCPCVPFGCFIRWADSASFQMAG